MKRFFTSILAAFLLISTLASCSANTAPDESGAASSSASAYAAALPAGAVAAYGDETAEYGVDMSAFCDDGYIIRAAGDDISVFAKTEKALDTAVRRFSREYIGGELYIVNGEGPKVKQFEICGTDISEFAIVYPTSTPYGCFEENYKYTAERFQYYIESATGVTVPVFTDRAPGFEHTITLVCDTSLGLGGSGFEIRTDNASMTVTGETRGAMYGMFEVLERYLGFRFLAADNIYIYEAELCEIPADTYIRQIPQFFHRSVYPCESDELSVARRLQSDNVTQNPTYGGGSINETMHGYHEYIPSNPWFVQPCLTDPGILEECVENIIAHLRYVEQTYPGFENEITRAIRLGHDDQNGFCTCRNCMLVFKEEGNFSGLNVRFCNAVCEEVNAVFDEEIYIGMFAYWGAVNPPKKTAPLPNVVVTYCMYQMCWNHVLGESECDASHIGYDKLTNIVHLDNLRRWCEITDKVIIYWYGSSANCHNLYENMKLMAEAGAQGMMTYSTLEKRELGMLSDYLFSKLAWNPTMPEEEYEAIYREAMRLFYGEGADYIEHLWDIHDVALTRTVCFSQSARDTTDFDYLASRYDEIVSSVEKAISLAENSKQQSEIEEFAAVLYFGMLSGSYEERYVNGTEEEKQDFTEKYKQLYDWYRLEFGAKPSAFDPDLHPFTLFNVGEWEKV